MIVIDASAVLELLLGTRTAALLAERVLDPAESLHVPQLLDVEVVHALRRYTLAGQLKPAEGQRALVDLRDLPLHRHDHLALLDRIWELRTSVSAYDGAYVALAEALGCSLLTCDRKLGRAHGHRARIEVL